MKKYIIIMAKDRTAIRRQEVYDVKGGNWKPGDSYWVENKEWIVGTAPCTAVEAETIIQAVLTTIKKEWDQKLEKP